MLDDHLLSIVTLGPTVFAVFLLFIPMRWKLVHRIVTLIVSIVMFAFSTRLWTSFNSDDPGYGGSGAGTMEAYAWQAEHLGRPYTLQLSLPPLATLIVGLAGHGD